MSGRGAGWRSAAIAVLVLALVATCLPGHGARPGATAEGASGAERTVAHPPPGAAPSRRAHSGATYTLTFRESGLPAGTSWWVSANGTESSTSEEVVFTVAPGTYYYVIPDVGDSIPTPAEGSVTVGSADATVAVTFQLGYPVAFVATGLPAATSWYLSVNDTLQSGASTNGTILLPLANGTYNTTSLVYSGCATPPTTNTVTVAGGPAVDFVPFLPAMVRATFFEFGLPAGGSWSLEFGASFLSAPTGSPIELSAYCGTYPLSVVPVAGYGLMPVAGDGASPVYGLPLTYLMHLQGPGGLTLFFYRQPGWLDLPGDQGTWVFGLLVGLAVVVTAAGIFVRTRR